MSTADFRALYERHVHHVVTGDMRAALADMVPANLATVFDGVTVPRGTVHGCEIKAVRAEGDKQIGEAIYDTPAGAIGLRSIWEMHDGMWKAAALENFPVTGSPE